MVLISVDTPQQYFFYSQYLINAMSGTTGETSNNVPLLKGKPAPDSYKSSNSIMRLRKYRAYIIRMRAMLNISIFFHLTISKNVISLCSNMFYAKINML